MKRQSECKFKVGKRGNKMRVCRADKAIVKNHGKIESIEVEKGFFHQWGTEPEEFENGVGQMQIALIELPDGRMATADIHDIQFID